MLSLLLCFVSGYYPGGHSHCDLYTMHNRTFSKAPLTRVLPLALMSHKHIIWVNFDTLSSDCVRFHTLNKEKLLFPQLFYTLNKDDFIHTLNKGRKGKDLVTTSRQSEASGHTEAQNEKKMF